MLAKKTLENELAVYDALPEVFQTPSLAGLIACCQVIKEIREKGELADSSFLKAVQDLINEALLQLPIKGKEINLIPHIDPIYTLHGEFKRKTHEEQLHQNLAKNKLSINELLLSLDHPEIKMSLERLFRREQLCKDLLETAKKNNTASIASCLIALGKAYEIESQIALEMERSYVPTLQSSALIFYHAAAKFYCEEELVKKIAKLEELLLKTIGIENPSAQPWELHKAHQIKLSELKAFVSSQLEELTVSRDEKFIHKVDLLQEVIAERTKCFIKELIQECLDVLGAPPCKYAMIGFGSLEKHACTVYSDLEFGFLLEAGQDTVANRVYFRHLCYLLQVKVIGLGETPIPKSLLGYSLDKITGRGFSFDLGGKTPLGRLDEIEQQYELIAEPNKLVNYVEDTFFSIDKLLPIEVAQCSHITGSEEITNTYQELLQTRFSRKDDQGRNFSQIRACRLLKADLERFNPSKELSEKIERLLDVKNSIYRLPDRLIDNLALFFGIRAPTLFQKIEALHQKKLIHPASVNLLKMMVGIASLLRLKTYQFYGKQEEALALSSPIFKESVEAFIEGQTEILCKFYAIAIPFHEALNNFSNHCEKNLLSAIRFLKQASFWENPKIITPRVLIRLGKFKEAKDHLNPLIKSNQDNYNFLSDMALTFLRTGQAAKAIEWYTKCLECAKKNLDLILQSLLHLGGAYLDAGDIQNAHLHLETGLVKVNANPTFKEKYLYPFLINLGNLFMRTGQDNQARQNFELALRHLDSLEDKDHEAYALTLQNLGVACNHLGDFTSAKKYLHRALDLSIRLYGAEHTRVAQALDNLSHVSDTLEEFAQAKQLSEQAVKIFKKCYDAPHIEIARALNNLASANKSLGNLSEAKSMRKLLK